MQKVKEAWWKAKGVNREHLTPEFKHKNEVCVSFLNKQQDQIKNQGSLLLLVFLRLKKYSPVFLNACTSF